jgi:hypothetical protein
MARKDLAESNIRTAIHNRKEKFFVQSLDGPSDEGYTVVFHQDGLGHVTKRRIDEAVLEDVPDKKEPATTKMANLLDEVRLEFRKARRAANGGHDARH